jgi:putative sterol carrier protein
MAEVKIRGEDVSGLGWTMKSLIDENLRKPEIWSRVKKLKGTLVVCETDSKVTNTVFFNKGEIEIEDGAISRPTARVSACFDALTELTSGQVGPIKAVLTGRIKAGGNLLKLLKMAKALIHNE